MRVHARYVVLIVLALLSLACETADQSRELDLMYAVVTLPQGFRHEWGVGDTPCGKLVSRDGKTVMLNLTSDSTQAHTPVQEKRDKLGSERASWIASHIRSR